MAAGLGGPGQARVAEDNFRIASASSVLDRARPEPGKVSQRRNRGGAGERLQQAARVVAYGTRGRTVHPRSVLPVPLPFLRFLSADVSRGPSERIHRLAAA